MNDRDKIEILLITLAIASVTVGGLLAGFMYASGVNTTFVVAVSLCAWSASMGYTGAIFAIRGMEESA